MADPFDPTCGCPRGRIAMVSVHTSPLAQPGTGDAGGMNVYIRDVAVRLAARGLAVDIFTRRTTSALPSVVELAPGVTVRHIAAGPYEGLSKEDLPGQLCAFAAGMMRVAAHAPQDYYDLVHSHYWLSGQVGRLAADRWDIPLVHTMHTMARVKNLHLAAGDTPEPPGREAGEAQVAVAADRLVANTPGEARELIDLYAADPAIVEVVEPGVDLAVFRPGPRDAARATLGLRQDAVVLLFVGRIQPLKAPDLLIRVAAELVRRDPSLRERLVVAILGGASGAGVRSPMGLPELAAGLGVGDLMRFATPADRATLAQWYRAADIVAVPSYSESFGLVAVEAQACGAVVAASAVGGLPTAVGDGGVLIGGHHVHQWADAIEGLLADPARRHTLGLRAAERARAFSWDRTVDRLLAVYRDALNSPRQAHGDGDPLVGVPAAVMP